MYPALVGHDIDSSYPPLSTSPITACLGYPVFHLFYLNCSALWCICLFFTCLLRSRLFFLYLMIFSETVCGLVVFVLLHPCLPLLFHQFAPQIKQLGRSVDTAKPNIRKTNRHADTLMPFRKTWTQSQLTHT